MSFSPDAPLRTLFNRCNLSPWAIGDLEFQERPRELEIAGVREADQRLFRRLAAIDDPAERGLVFHDYVSVKFRLHEWGEHASTARSSIRSSYLQFLRNWGADSNGHAGAVLKSWVESRFGLPATFHGGRLETDPEARRRYAIDRMRGAAKTVGAMMQLDLLYTFCQDELARRFPGERWRTLYRGTHDPEEYAIRPSENAVSGTTCVQLNNLSSFTADREIAWEFGSSVWEVAVPLQKIVFFSGLLPRHLLEGESEYLILGGEYRVRRLLH
jgi:NAD+--dinitrogen-reductase ADP-D-ribosyltransferase